MTEVIRIVDITLKEATDLKSYLEDEFRRLQGEHDIKIVLIVAERLPPGLRSPIPPGLIIRFPEIVRNFENPMAQATGRLTTTFAITKITHWIKNRRPKTDAKIFGITV